MKTGTVLAADGLIDCNLISVMKLSMLVMVMIVKVLSCIEFML